MFEVVTKGHTYKMQNRGVDGFVDSTQTVQYLEVQDGAIIADGIFLQDDLKRVIDRVEYLIECSPHKSFAVQRQRQNALFYLQKSLDCWDKSTMIRLELGDNLIGHVKDEKI